MNIQLNGKTTRIGDEVTVQQLVVANKLTAGQVVVERNGEIVPRDQYGTTRLGDGDAIEILQFVGGGS